MTTQEQEQAKKEPDKGKKNKFSIKASTVFLNLVVVLAVCMACYFTYNVVTGNNIETSSEAPFTPVTEEPDETPPPETSAEEVSSGAGSSSDISGESSAATDSGSEDSEDSGSEESGEEVSSEEESSAAIDEYDQSFFSNTLFIGDSISTGLSLYGFVDADYVFAIQGLAPSTLFSTEIGGETCESKISSVKPERIVIMLGSNGIGYGEIDVIAQQMCDTLATLKSLFKGEIGVVSVSPITLAAEQSTDNALSSSAILTYNATVKEYAEANGMTYIDLYTPLTNGTDYFYEDYAEPDGIHFSGKAYQIMLSTVQKAFE